MVYTKEVSPVEIIMEGSEQVIKINYDDRPYTPSIEDNPLVMMDAIDRLLENPSASRITFSQKRNYAYNYDQTKMLIELANIYSYFIKSKRATSLQSLGLPNDTPELLGQRLSIIQTLMLTLLKQDPLGAYAELKRIIRRETINQKTNDDPRYKDSLSIYLRVLNEIFSQLDKTLLIAQAREYLPGYTSGDRDVYRLIFKPSITPDFMFTRIQASPPLGGEELDVYKINDSTEVNIYRTKDEIKPLYHITPPEYKISEDKFELIDLAKKVLSEHQPRSEEFLDPEKMRSSFTNISKDLIRELAEQKGLFLSPEEIEEMAEILVRNTIGFGVVELLLQDEKIQDLTINSPMGQVPIFILHETHNECTSNITPTTADFESWATKFRLLSGRPLDEANPILDTEVILPKARSRLSIIGKPLNPYGYGMSFRRHRDTPWTLPLFIKNKMISPLGAGLLSFTIDGARAHLIAGTRSSGKCLEGEEKVQLSNGELVNIKDLVEQSLYEDGYAECEDGYYAFVNNKKIISLNEDLKLTEKEITCVWKRKAPNFLYKIKLRSGKIITTTPEHPVLTMDQTSLGYLPSSKIIAGKRIASVRELKTTPQRKYSLEIDPSLFTKRTNAKEIKLPKEITSELLEIIGYILADGHLFNGGVQFINQEEKLRTRFNTLLFSLFALKGKEKIDIRNHVPFIQVHSKILVRYFNQIFNIPIGDKAGIIKLPNIILSLEDSDLAPLLRALFDCDGYTAKNDREIEYSSKSEELISQLQLILSRFKIISFKKTKLIHGETYFSLFINGASYNHFCSKISFNHPIKKLKSSMLSNKKYLETTNIDSIPYANTLLKELRSRLLVSPLEFRNSTGKDYWAYENFEYNASHNWFKKIIPFYENKFNELKAMDLTNLYNLSYVLANQRAILQNLKFLCKELDISQQELARIVNSPIKNSFDNECSFFIDSLFNLSNALKIIDLKIHALQNPDTSSLISFLKDTNLSCAKLAREVNHVESAVKHYYNKDIFHTNPKITKYLKYYYHVELNQFREKLAPIYRNVHNDLSLIKSINLDACFEQIASLKNKFHLNHDEFNLNITSVSNFFLDRHQRVKLDNLQRILKTILENYEIATSNETKDLIKLSKNLCSDDLFWDEVISIEKVKPKYDWVYDLTIEPNHNFIANGLVAHNTSFLTSLLLEISRKYRILTIEDTLEIPTDAMRELGYNVQPLKVRSALVKGGSEVPADEGIRTSLRLGDSALIVGEVRSTEALALYEAMRIGASANVVAGTIHGDSPYGIFDRVVNDLKVPKTSFKATDLIVMCAPIRSADGMKKFRRVTSITEVRKTWEEDPLAERGFVDLMKYNAKTDMLEPTPELINGDSEVLKAIGANVREWVGNWDAIWDNIVLRGELKKMIVDYSEKLKMPELLEAEFCLHGNDQFYRISSEVQSEVGSTDVKKIKFEWEEWLKREIRKKQMR